MATPKILLIDDDVELLDMLEAYLQREELVVTVTNVAATGMAAGRCRPNRCGSSAPMARALNMAWCIARP